MIKKRSNTANLLLILGTVIVSAFLIKFLRQFETREVLFEQVLIQASIEVNKSCPMQIGKDIRLDYTVGGPGNVMAFNYTLVNHVGDISDSLKFDSLIRFAAVELFKTNRELDIFLDNNVTFICNFQDKNGVEIKGIEFSPSDFIDREFPK